MKPGIPVTSGAFFMGCKSEIPQHFGEPIISASISKDNASHKDTEVRDPDKSRMWKSISFYSAYQKFSRTRGQKKTSLHYKNHLDKISSDKFKSG